MIALFIPAVKPDSSNIIFRIRSSLFKVSPPKIG
nr:MAG TPA: hypothetical protein [Caudoviricetes sp.]